MRESDAEAGVEPSQPNPAVQPILDELSNRLNELHPADIACVLEALPLAERLVVWNLIKTAERDGDILVEVSDSVRETLIDSMELADRIVMMTNWPRASIGDELRIEPARPRDRLALAGDARFAAYRKQMLEFLFLKQRVRESTAQAVR